MAKVKDHRRTSLAQYPESTTLAQYKEVMVSLLHLSFPSLTEWEIASAVDISITKHFNDKDVVVDNNYKNKKANMTLLELADYINDREPIITSFGVLFNRHGVLPNPIYKMVDGFIAGRKIMKKEMFKYPKGSEDFEKYNLLQLLLKLGAYSGDIICDLT